jgi:hypothetical protein
MLFRGCMFLWWATSMMFSRLWRIRGDWWWTMTATWWFTWTLRWRKVSIAVFPAIFLFLLRVALFIVLVVSPGVSRLAALFLRFTRLTRWLLSWLWLVSMLGCMMFPRFAPLLLLLSALLICWVLIATTLCCHLPWHGRLQIISVWLIISLMLLFLAADGLYEVTLWGLMLQYFAALFPLSRVVLHFHLVGLRLLPGLPRVDTSWYLVVISMSMASTIANLLMCTFCVTLILRVLYIVKIWN